MTPAPGCPDPEGLYRKLLTTLPDGPQRAAAERFLRLYHQETQWHAYAGLSWLGATPQSVQGEYGPACTAPGLHLAHAVEVRAKSRRVPCTVFACRCRGNCGKYFVMPTALYRDGQWAGQMIPAPTPDED